jgi:LmbE family N-acetylglucosaminyl deacetylase
MAIAAHPGDGMFTMGAAVAQHVHDGGKGIFLSLSLGERGSNTIPTPEYGAYAALFHDQCGQAAQSSTGRRATRHHS